MIPSRGIRPAGHAFITCQQQLRVSTPSTRLFSSKPSHTTFSIPPSRTPRINGLPPFRTIGSSNASFVPALFSSAAFFARHASTAPPPSAAPSATAVSSPPPAPSFDALPDTSSETISSITDLPPVDISSIPEQIGYLKSLGLEYGYGPTSVVQWVLEHVHVYAGTPWWASIMIAAVLIRLGVFVFWYRAANDTAKIAALSAVLGPLNARLKDTMMSSQTTEAVQVRAQISEVYRSMGIKQSRTFVPIVVQGMLGFGAFKLMRAMGNLPVPGWENGGFGWITDLTVSDPYYILPVALAGVVYITTARGGESGSMNSSAMGGTPGMAGALAAMKYIAPALMGLIMLTFPAGLQLSFMVTSMFGLLQSYVLRNNKIREAIGLLPLLPPAPPGGDKVSKAPVINYQAPTAQDTLAKVSAGDLRGASSLASVAGKGAEKEKEKEGKSGGMLSGVKKELGGAKEQVGLLWKTVKAKVGAAQSQAKDGQKSQQFKRQAEAYERRKQKEIEEQRRWEREEMRERKERY